MFSSIKWEGQGWGPLRLLPSLMTWNSHWSVSWVHRGSVFLFKLLTSRAWGSAWPPRRDGWHSFIQWTELSKNIQTTFLTSTHIIPYNESRSSSETILNLSSLLNSPWKAEKVTIGITYMILIIVTKLGLRENQHPDQPCSQPLRGLLPSPGLRPESPMASRALPGPDTASLHALALLRIFQSSSSTSGPLHRAFPQPGGVLPPLFLVNAYSYFWSDVISLGKPSLTHSLA